MTVAPGSSLKSYIHPISPRIIRPASIKRLQQHPISRPSTSEPTRNLPPRPTTSRSSINICAGRAFAGTRSWISFLLVLLVQSVLIAAVCILLPLMLFHRQPEWEQRPLSWLAYFGALGLGYIMVEIALLQRFLLFLGQPIYTYAVILAGLLIFTGVGSWAAGRMKQADALRRSLVLALAVVAITALVTPPVFQFFLGYTLPVRIAISLLLVAPLGVALGMPFPLGLRLASAQTTSIGAWAWGVNGFFTVIGTVLALILGMIFGFRVVLLLSALCYAGALLVAGRQAKASTKTPLTARVNV
jgi:hypothetical protein